MEMKLMYMCYWYTYAMYGYFIKNIHMYNSINELYIELIAFKNMHLPVT